MTQAPSTPGYLALLLAEGVRLLPQGRVEAAGALLGCSPAEALALAPLLNALCPQAHAIALSRALEAVADAPAPAELEAAREAQLALEAGAAAAFRFALGWPAALGLASAPEPVRAARTAAARGEGPKTAAALRMALPLAAQVRELALGAGLSEAAARLDALLSQAQALAERLQGVQIAPPPACVLPKLWEGTGAGEALSLRGPLRANLSLKQGRIEAASLSSPTQRLAAPGGPIAQALAALGPGPDRLAQAQLTVLSFDPCLPIRVAEEVSHA